MRWRAVGGLLGAAVLAAAVLVLREQVPPPAYSAAPEPPITAELVDRPGLPAFEPMRTPRWRQFTPPRRALDGVVGVQYLLHTRTDRDSVEFIVQRRDTGEQAPAYSVPQDEAPWSGVLHRGLLLVSHGYPEVRLVVLDPAAQQPSPIRELTPPPGYSFSPHLVELGDEVLMPGRQQDPARSCVLAVQPQSGAARPVWCAPQGRSPGWLYAGVDQVVWPEFTNPPTVCPHWFRLRAGGEVEQLVGHPALCGAREVTDFGGWQVTLRSEHTGARPQITATDGSRRLVLGTAAGFVACGRHVYWSAAAHGAGEDTLYRWRPGTEHREVVHRSSRLVLTAPRCSEGVLSVGEMAGSGPRMVELRALNRP